MAEFYERLGLTFEHHRHGKGPYHFSARIGPTLLEIYPLAKGQESADTHLRLGIAVYPFETIIHELQEQEIYFHQPPILTEWGIMAVIEDPEKRKIELIDAHNILWAIYYYKSDIDVLFPAASQRPSNFSCRHYL